MNLQTAIVEDSKPDAERLKQLLKKAFENENISCSCFCGPAGAKGIRWCFWTSAWRAPMALRRRSGCVRPTRTC